ncbi:tetratricopeptide repeat protein [Candidatus Zixiibacteriota bacterium]
MSSSCPNCRHDVSNKNNFCPNCGTPLSKKAQEKSKTIKKSKPNPTRDMAIIVGVIVIIAVGYYFITKPSAPPPQTQQEDFSHPDVGMDMGSMGDGLELPSNYNELIAYGNNLMDQGNFPLAAESYKRALNINPKDHNVRTDFGACLHSMGLNERALEEFYRVTGNEPNHPIANFNLGIVYYTMQNADSAKFYWSKYLEIDPNGSAAPLAREKLQELGG